MSEINESLLERVRALLAKAEATEFPAEAEALTAKATELMARHGIERALLADTDPSSDIIGDRQIPLLAPYARDKRGLLATIAKAFGCQVINRQHGSRISAILFGYDSDLDRAETLFTSLLVQASHALAVTSVPWHENPAAFRRTWYAGYAKVVGQRLRAAEARARAESSSAQEQTVSGKSTELVFVDRAAKLDRAWEERTAGMPKSRTRRLSGGGWNEGKAAGARADLGGRKVTGGRRRALGG